jgi:hypothetical protein
MARGRDRKRNQTWLRKRLKVSQQRVSQLIRREGWRWGKFGWTDAELKEIKAWHAELREENPATSSDPSVNPLDAAPAITAALMGDVVDPQELLKLVTKPDQRIKLMGVIERAAKVKVDRELLLGGYLKKEDVEAGRLSRVQAVRAELANVRLLAMKMQGMGVIEMERVLEDWARNVCEKFEGGQA